MNTPQPSKGVMSIVAVVIGAVLVLTVTTSRSQITSNAERSVRNEEKITSVKQIVKDMDKKFDDVLMYIYSSPK